MYSNVNPYFTNNYNGDRFGFFVPFLLGGLAGSAVVGVTRPRPVYVTPAQYPRPYYPYY